MKKIKIQYEEREIQPSVDLWSGLEAKLDSQQQSFDQPSSSKPSFGWWKYAAAAALLISVGYIALQYFNRTDVEPIAKIDSEKTEEIIIKEPAEVIAQKSVEITQSQSTQLVNEIKVQEIVPNQSVVRQVVAKTPSVFSRNGETALSAEIPESKKVEFPKPSEPVFAVAPEPVKEKRSVSYINADELLFAREVDRKRNQAEKEESRFAEIDLSKIKRRPPSSVKILGITVFENSESSH